MIDVPVAVKDALREGSYRKNYRFNVLEIPAVPTLPAGYYEISRILSGQKYVIPADGSYKIVADVANAFTGIITWVDDEEADWLAPQITTPSTEANGGFNEGEIISVAGMSGIDDVSVMKYYAERPGKDKVDGFTIDNNTLVSESVSFDEHMATGCELKFGLCEGTSIEFQYFDHPNINGRQIQAFIDIQHDFTWTEVATIAGTDYDDYTIGADGLFTLKIPANQGSGLYVICYHDGEDVGGYVPQSNEEQELSLGQLSANDEIQISTSGLGAAFSVTLERGDEWYTIPMGFFTVDKCSRQASTGIHKVTAYNKLMSDYLDNKANSLIEEAVTEGEDGRPAETVSLRTILDRLLGDYYIEVKPDINKSFNFNLGHTSYNADCFTRLNSQLKNSGYYLKISYMTRYVLVDGGFNSNSYYRVTFNPKAIDAYFENLRKNLIRDSNDELYLYYAGDLPQSYSAGSYGTYYEQWYIRTYEKFMVGSRLSYSILDNRDKEFFDTGWMTGLSGLYVMAFNFPVIHNQQTSYDTNVNSTAMETAFTDFLPYLQQYMTVTERNLSDMEKKIFTLSDVSEWGDVTLRELQSSVFETECQYGQLDRITDLFTGVELNQSALYPQDTLYPSDALFPSGVRESAFKSQYSKLWTDTGGEQNFRYLIITYKGLDGDGNETDYTLQRTVNANGTTDYNMSDNWLFRNLIWTAEQVGEYADAMVAKMQNIKWFPFEMWAAGLPYLETGDMIEIAVGEDTYTSYILQRQLKGIQNLQDTYIYGELDVF